MTTSLVAQAMIKHDHTARSMGHIGEHIAVIGGAVAIGKNPLPHRQMAVRVDDKARRRRLDVRVVIRVIIRVVIRQTHEHAHQRAPLAGAIVKRAVVVGNQEAVVVAPSTRT